MTAETLLLVAGIGGLLTTVYWAKQREMREKYAVFWVLLGLGVFILGAFPVMIYKMASWFQLANSSVVLFFTLIALFLWAFSVTISLSRLYRKTTRLAQEVGLLNKQLSDIKEAREDV
ncbi:MAG: DUF2304 domain-containing protein [Lentisphaeria bacterium]|nr:DUF2304 domain-containing protein [Lentisphaeria bacterium]